ncbi:MAG: PIG-L family deacetylase [Acidobacteria bacterium]|nr:PIG-L family deacetylase [Acidobacteriota bacterium]
MKRYILLTAILLILAALAGVWADNRNVYLLPEDRGTAGTLAALKKLPVYARVLHIIAHPDDESAATLTWLSRKFHAQTALFCLTRGEGGQNILGNEKYEALGLVRTGEGLEACRYYGSELYFGSNLDFGFSKNAEETLSKWGHDAALQELVEFIRRWRPTVIISRFQGDSADGHGHHQAAGILAREAFRAAGDPQRFPKRLQPWQAKRLYVSSRAGSEPSSGGEKPQIVKVPVGDYDPILGRSYREIAAEGYSKHRTQGTGNTYALPGIAYETFRMVESVARDQTAGDSFFASIDTSLQAIYDLAGDDKQAVPFLKDDLVEIQKAAEEALSVFQISSPEKSAKAVARGAGILRTCIEKIRKSSLPESAKKTVEDALQIKLLDFHKAANAVLGIRLVIKTGEPTAVPGERMPIELLLCNQGPESFTVADVAFASGGIEADTDWEVGRLKGKEVAGRSSLTARAFCRILPDAQPTEPYWHLEKSTDARYQLRNSRSLFFPFSRTEEISFVVTYAYQGVEFFVEANGMAEAGDPLRGSDFVDFQIVPALSVSMNPAIEISPTGSKSETHKFQVSVLNNQRSGVKGKLKLFSPEGWRSEPGELDFSLSRKGETFSAKFMLQSQSETKPGSYQVKAIATAGGKTYQRGYDVISYPENWTRHLYRPSQSIIERFDISVAPNLAVGYIAGAGDEIPAALERLGIKPRILSANDLAFGDLSGFSTIITGIRAYNVNTALQTNNQRLLNYVADGGNLIVQYVRPSGGPGGSGMGSPFLFGPYPMSVSSSDRITVEDSPIRILDPAHPLFNQPNRITEDDFRGWVQERGLYFMNTWDQRYTSLLSGNDPVDAPQNGGMLYARYGKGNYIYTAYAWFRQLPAINPGAFRIFANMISLGRR